MKTHFAENGETGGSMSHVRPVFLVHKTFLWKSGIISVGFIGERHA